MRTKLLILLVLILVSCTAFAQEDSPAKSFWNTLQSHCGKAYEGSLALPKEDDDFGPVHGAAPRPLWEVPLVVIVIFGCGN